MATTMSVIGGIFFVGLAVLLCQSPTTTTSNNVVVVTAFTPTTTTTSTTFVPVMGRRRIHSHASSTTATALATTASSSATTENTPLPPPPPDMDDVGFVVLAGGTGSRMKASMPKQYLPLKDTPVLHYSLDLFLERLGEYCLSQNTKPPKYVVLVMDPLYQDQYRNVLLSGPYKERFSIASPGVERQGSVENGVKALVELSNGQCQYVAIHDSARPLVTIQEICNVVRDAKEHGAAVLGVPCKATIKESNDGTFVQRTIPRSRLWEVHTPQVIKVETLLRGFEKVEAENLEVTDDVSIVEALEEPVKLTLGEYTNLKITTPEDMDVATAILNDRSDGGRVSNIFDSISIE
eukprot:CAMPEP_0113473542 /NCGR_PEP_ID=MMETSP0014_2-20120614/18100_1 /TAXON_ID=2857 /ORGANISM="Nitzschia sp." /LENGTH=349 /DNA_ID=CAMNT_0000366317 /DNA_START=84 /DNA_END=1133 /DNA_ORIENTATION=+ /assembly_acc=CAM_ASM_000159